MPHTLRARAHLPASDSRDSFSMGRGGEDDEVAAETYRVMSAEPGSALFTSMPMSTLSSPAHSRCSSTNSDTAARTPSSHFSCRSRTPRTYATGDTTRGRALWSFCVEVLNSSERVCDARSSCLVDYTEGAQDCRLFDEPIRACDKRYERLDED